MNVTQVVEKIKELEQVRDYISKYFGVLADSVVSNMVRL